MSPAVKTESYAADFDVSISTSSATRRWASGRKAMRSCMDSALFPKRYYPSVARRCIVILNCLLVILNLSLLRLLLACLHGATSLAVSAHNGG